MTRHLICHRCGPRLRIHHPQPIPAEAAVLARLSLDSPEVVEIPDDLAEALTAALDRNQPARAWRMAQGHIDREHNGQEATI
jgi:hypothetical protein